MTVKKRYRVPVSVEIMRNWFAFIKEGILTVRIIVSDVDIRYMDNILNNPLIEQKMKMYKAKSREEAIIKAKFFFGLFKEIDYE